MMAQKFEWKMCVPFQPAHIPGVEISETEKHNVVAFGTNIGLPDEGPCLSLDYSIELLKKLKKAGCTKYHIERVDRPGGGYVVAFVGDDNNSVGIIAPIISLERDSGYWTPPHD
jgi:hypothetical protein